MEGWIKKLRDFTKEKLMRTDYVDIRAQTVLDLIAEIERLEKENTKMRDTMMALTESGEILKIEIVKLRAVVEAANGVDWGHIVLMMGTFDNYTSKIQIEKLKELQQALRAAGEEEE